MRILQIGNIYKKARDRGRIFHPEGICPTLVTSAGGGSVPFIVLNLDQKQNGNWNGVRQGYEVYDVTQDSPSLRTTQTVKVLGEDMKIRKLTPIECEKLQGYPCNWTKYGRKEDGTVIEMSDTQRYKMIGNGISSPVSKGILETLLPEGDFKVMSTFSGCGGTEILLDKRFEVIGHSEFDKYTSWNLHYNYPEIKNYGDITKINSKELPNFDILLAGFPCQSWSTSGLRKGFDDAQKGQLIYDVFRIMREKSPKYVLIENVKGLLSHNKGGSIQAILEGISSLGYTFDFNLVNSKAFGLAQNRERIFIFCMRNDWWCKGLGLTQPKSEAYGKYLKIRDAKKQSITSTEDE